MQRFVPDFSEITSAKLIPYVQSYLSGELEVCLMSLTTGEHHY